MAALTAEFIKLRHSKVVWVTFAAFALAPLMGGVFIMMAKNPGAVSGTLNAKAQMMNFAANWHSYLDILEQAIGVGGILVFGFIASWLFGREYSDGTAKDLLALPTSRTRILNAKFIVYIAWSAAVAISNLLIAFGIGMILQLPTPDLHHVSLQLGSYFITTLLTILIGTPIAFFALWGKGYLAPLGFVAITLVFAQVIAATGYGYYFPWSVPGLYSGAGGAYKSQLNSLSFALLIATSMAGYFAALAYWKYADQSQ